MQGLTSSSIFPKCLLGDVICLIHHLRWNAEPTEHLHGKEAEVGMSAEQGPNANQKRSIDRRHDHQGADAIAPRTLLKAALQPQNVRHGRPHQHHGRRARDGEYGTDEDHLAVPSQGPPRRHFLGRHPSLQECRSGRRLGFAAATAGREIPCSVQQVS